MRPPAPAAWSSPNLSRIPSSCPRAQFAPRIAELSLRNCGAGRASNHEPTGRAKDARPMTSFSTTASGGAGGQDASQGASAIGPETGPVGIPLADAGHLRQMNGAAECLLDQVKGVDQHTHVDEPIRPE